MHYKFCYLVLACVSLSHLSFRKSDGGKLESENGSETCYDAEVVIIGAGIAGTTFARELARNSIHDYLIIEGRNESGGRFQDIRIGNVTVELGPNWIHGTKNNPVFELVKKYGITGKNEDPNSLICRDKNGENVTNEFLHERSKLNNIMRSLIGENYKLMSLRNALRENGWENRTAIENVVEYSVIDYMDAAPPEKIQGECDQSKKSRIKSLTGAQFFITEQAGYKRLVDGIQQEALGENSKRLKLGHFVTKIKWGKRGVRVETSQGQVFTGKVLLATPSIGVYQNMPDLFEPKLPAWKRAAFQKFKMATYTKIFLKFPYRFWDNLEYIFYASGTRRVFPVWQSLDAENRFGFETNILMVTVTSSESERIEKISKDELKSEIMHHLSLMYGSNIPRILDIVVPKWKTNKYFYGSYSLSPENATHLDFVALRANVGPIFFAGEASHETYQGYIHGAFYEGKNRAYDVMQALNGFWNLNDIELNKDFYDSCLRDIGDSCNLL